MVRRVPGGSATALGVVLALLVPGLIGAAFGTHPSTPAPGSPAALGSPCSGNRITSRFPGYVGTDHPFGHAPSVGGLMVTIDFEYQENNSSSSGYVLACRTTNATGVTSSSGTFLLNLSVPSGSCNGAQWCLTNTGPFGPFSFHLNRSDPPGDLLRAGWRRDRMELVWTSALGGVSVTPAGPINTSVNDPLRLTAEALAGDGSRSPADLSYLWLVKGGAWQVEGGGSNASASVESVGTGGAGIAAVEVTGSYNGTAMGSIIARVSVDAIVTRIETGALAPVAADEGQSIVVQLVGDGAVGFSYNATVYPGLEQPAVPLSCLPSPGGSTDVVVDCTGAVVYAAVGIASPSAILSNGHSNATWNFSNLTVAPPPEFSFTPDPAMGYSGAPIRFGLALAGATGTAPFGPACVASGTGAIDCAPPGGSTWSIDIAYARPGRYVAEGSVVDATGSNETRTVPVTVADLPRLGPVAAPTDPLFVGGVDDLTANLSGGLWPLSYYWNDSIPGTTVAEGSLERDGAIQFAFTPTAPGLHQLSLVVVDAGGTRRAATVALDVGPGIPVRWEAIGGGDLPPVLAGQPANVSLRAVDRFGNSVAGFDPTLQMHVVGPGPAGHLEVNTPQGSASSPAGTDPTGQIPAAAWGPSGLLNLSLSSLEVGTWRLNLTGAPDLPGATLPISVVVRADDRGPKLLDPSRARSDPRSASTLWSIEDPYGNPILTGYIVIRTEFPSGVLDVDAPILAGANAGKVWVNYTAIGSDAGTVVVLSAYGLELLPTIQVPAASVLTVPWDGVTILGGSTIVTLVAIVFALRGRRRATPSEADGDAELERHAAGRDHLLRVLSDQPVDSFAFLASGWTGPAPRPDRPELIEWLSGLIAEGAIVAQYGPHGRPEFLRADAREVRSDLVLDDAALETALAHREVPSDGSSEPSIGGT
ncbi:MAG: hypothetical protein L3K08_00585 [Thermoplasmata archaeon]|nr:hypothetical protein [Thermoplasmata archaeon]